MDRPSHRQYNFVNNVLPTDRQAWFGLMEFDNNYSVWLLNNEHTSDPVFRALASVQGQLFLVA